MQQERHSSSDIHLNKLGHNTVQQSQNIIDKVTFHRRIHRFLIGEVLIQGSWTNTSNTIRFGFN